MAEKEQEKTVMPEFDIENFKSGQNLVINASAGTGKTYTICEIVDRLVNSGTDMAELLIVTYTEKAAQELKDRIRAKLAQAKVAADVDKATIGTIHSFCQKTIEEFCIASGKPANLTLIDEDEAGDFARQYLRTEGLLQELAALKGYAAFAEYGLDVETSFVKKFKAIANHYYLDKNYQEDASVVSLAGMPDEDIVEVFDYILAGKATDGIKLPKIEEALSVFKNSAKPELNSLFAGLTDSKNHKYNFDGNTYRENFYRTGPDGKKTKEKIFATDEEKAAFRLIKKCKDNLKDLNPLIKYIVTKHAAAFYQRWLQEKARRGVQTYNDMIRNVREEVVSGGPLLQALQKKYKLAIIDEFQDTNQKQWDIFKAVFLSKDHNIIVVLDPKQSIYAFQGSDLTVSTRAIAEINGDNYYLPKNYRATKEIIESTGKFFANEIALKKDLNFVPSQCGKTWLACKFDGEEVKEPFWIWNPVPAEEQTGKAKLSEQEQYAKVVCQTIIDCCTKNAKGETRLRIVREGADSPSGYAEDNVSFKDFAILARTRSEMPEIKKALEDSGIPYLQYKDNAVFNGIEGANWIAVLEAIAEADFSGRNRAKFRKALYTIFFGYTLEEINNSEFDKDTIPEILLFDKWRALAGEGLWEELITSIMVDTDLYGKLNSFKDIKTLGIFKQIGSYCIECLAKRPSLEALILSLKRLQKNSSDEEAGDAGLTAISSDFDCVKLMTIHASKGLEFPVVISVAGFKELRNSSDHYIYHETAPDGTCSTKLSFSKPAVYKTEMKEEWQRLFYVAYTRAKYLLLLPNYAKTGMSFIKASIEAYMDKYPYHSLADNQMDYTALRAETGKILNSNRAVQQESLTAEEEQRAALQKFISQKRQQMSYKHTYSSLSHQHRTRAEVLTDEKIALDNGEETQEDSLSAYDNQGKQIACAYDQEAAVLRLAEDFPAGAGLGNAIHAVLELIDYTGPVRSEENEALINECFAREGFGRPCRWLEDIYKILENVLAARLPEIQGNMGTGKDFCLQELGREDRRNEVEFNFNREDEQLKTYFNGFIDLIFRRGEYYAVLDWKSDRLREDFSSYSDGAVVKAHIDELYSVQRALYAYCLIKWLQNFYPGKSSQEIFQQHFGGVYYVCVRGCHKGTGNGIYAQTWESFTELEKAYEKIIGERIGAQG